MLDTNLIFFLNDIISNASIAAVLTLSGPGYSTTLNHPWNQPCNPQTTQFLTETSMSQLMTIPKLTCWFRHHTWLVFLPSCCSWQGTPLQTQGEILPVLYNVFTLLILNGIHSLSVKNAAPLSFNKFSSLYSNVHKQKCIYHKSGFFSGSQKLPIILDYIQKIRNGKVAVEL